MKTLKAGLMSVVLLMTGCVSLSPDVARELRSTELPQNAATLIIYRHKSPQALLAKAHVGTKAGYFAALEQNQYLEIKLTSGFHELKARAHGSISSSLGVSTHPGQTTCLEVRPNHEDLGVLLVPFVNALVPSFVLQERPCPDGKSFNQLAKVPV